MVSVLEFRHWRRSVVVASVVRDEDAMRCFYCIWRRRWLENKIMFFSRNCNCYLRAERIREGTHTQKKGKTIKMRLLCLKRNATKSHDDLLIWHKLLWGSVPLLCQNRMHGFKKDLFYYSEIFCFLKLKVNGEYSP